MAVADMAEAVTAAPLRSNRRRVVRRILRNPLGLIAGYFRTVDALISRLTDLVLAFPFLILAVGLAAIRGASLGNAAIAIGIAQIPGMIRVVRSDTLRLKSLDFVAAAIVEGASDAWVLGRHILPNAGSAVIVQTTVGIPAAIL